MKLSKAQKKVLRIIIKQERMYLYSSDGYNYNITSASTQHLSDSKQIFVSISRVAKYHTTTINKALYETTKYFVIGVRGGLKEV